MTQNHLSRLMTCLVLISLFFSACSVKRDAYDVPIVPIPDSFQRAPADPASDQTPGTGESPSESTEPIEAGPDAILARTPLDAILPSWWQVLDNPELDRLVDMALARNQDLRMASFRVAHTEARFEQALGSRLPEISVPARAGVEAPKQGVGDNPRGTSVEAQNIFEISLRGDWRVDLWGERQAQAEAARYRLWKATFDHDMTQMNVIADLVTAYAEYLTLTDRLRLARETERVVQNMLDAVQIRLNQGDATRLDYEQQRSAVYSVKAVIPELERQREEVLHRLARVIGFTPTDLTTVGDSLQELALPRVLPGVPSNLLLRRPDVRSVEADLLAADADIDVARARILPPLDLTAQIGYGSRHFSELFLPHSLAYNAIASLSATLFDGGVRKSEVRYATARNEELVELYVRVLYDAVREVEDALATLRRTEERLAALDVACEASELAWEYSRTLYEIGSVDFLTLLITERTLHQNLDERLQVRLDRHKGLINLFRGLGGGVAVSGPLPGKGHRPEPISPDFGGLVLADPPVPLDDSLLLWNRDQGPAPDGDWEVELSGLYDRSAALATAREMHREHPDIMAGRHVHALESGVERADGEEVVRWYRLRLLPALSHESAQLLCDALKTVQRRCHLVNP